MNLKPPENDEFLKSLNSLKASDFDGHTAFSSMSPEERLMWLSQAAKFFFQNSRSLAAVQEKDQPDLS